MVWWWVVACGAPAPVPEPAVPEPALAAVAATAVPGELGRYPFCEPSAAVRLDDGALLVADNEGRPAKKEDDLRPTLWVVPVVGEGLGEPRPVAREEEKQDVESLVRLGDELWVLGSLSRNKEREVRPRRWRVEIGSWSAFTAAGATSFRAERAFGMDESAIRAVEADEAGCLRGLFVDGTEGAPAVCAAVVAGAAGGPTLNVEGAFAADGRVWLGLRAPLVDGAAVLVRLVPTHDALRFDAVRRLALGGEGVRELAVLGDRLVGLAGDVVDAPDRDADRSSWFSVPLAGLVDGVLPVTFGPRDLPGTAESFVVLEDRTLFLVDGESSKEAASTCVRPATWVSRDR